MDPNTIEAKIDSLGHNEAFAHVVEMIIQMRESAISDLYDPEKKTEFELARASGEIRAYDDLLRTFKYRDVLRRWDHILHAKRQQT